MAPITYLWLWLGDLKSDRVLCWGWAGSRSWRRGCWSQGRDDSDLSNSGVSAWSPLASDSVTIHWNNMIQLTDIHPALDRMMMSFYWPAPVLSISWWQHWQCSTDHRHVITPVSALLHWLWQCDSVTCQLGLGVKLCHTVAMPWSNNEIVQCLDFWLSKD